MYNKKENLPALRRTVCCLLLTSMLLAALLGFAMPTSAAGSDDTSRRTLRVGFYTYTGYHVMDEDGHRSGYSYEVLQRIAQHENVQFEYLAYDCDANEAADMLERGEIDLLPTLRKTDERAERFDFSSEPISNVATMLTVKAGNRSIVAGNYDTFDGMVVGMSRSGNGRNESFKAYAEKNGFTYTPVYFDTDEELSAALRSGTITAAVSNRMRQTSNEWVIDTFDNEDVYIAVRKGDASTLRLVNDALIRMDRDDPTWRTTLFDKYNKNIHTSNKLYLTAAEENYITAHNAADKEFTVLANPDRYPYSYLDKDGKLPATFMVVAPGSWNQLEVWDDINRMRTLNTTQSRRRAQMHVCPLQLDIVERIINRYSNEGDTVYDPFGGLMTVPMTAGMQPEPVCRQSNHFTRSVSAIT